MTLIRSDIPKPLFSPLPGDLRVSVHMHRCLRNEVGGIGGAPPGPLKWRLGSVPIAVSHEPLTGWRSGIAFRGFDARDHRLNTLTSPELGGWWRGTPVREAHRRRALSDVDTVYWPISSTTRVGAPGHRTGGVKDEPAT